MTEIIGKRSPLEPACKILNINIISHLPAKSQKKKEEASKQPPLFKDMTKAYDTIRQLNGAVVAGHDKQVVERFKQIQEGVVQIYPY